VAQAGAEHDGRHVSKPREEFVMISTKGVAVPDDMASTLESDTDALSAFEALRPDDQRVYVDWIGKARGEERSTRLAGLGEHIRNFQRRPAEEHGSPHPLTDV
jgi:uncharacterized protein YdeI (YjbR/CyaY-like superfamily)